MWYIKLIKGKEAYYLQRSGVWATTKDNTIAYGTRAGAIEDKNMKGHKGRKGICVIEEK